MDENQPIWESWARALQHWGIRDIVASLLETAGSLSVLAAQVLYLSQPLFTGAISIRALKAAAQTLENPVDRQKFVSILREAPTRGSGA